MAAGGPLPTGTAIRRNAPTIPTTNLPVTGRTTPTPDVPVLVKLLPAGADWWEWAWHTPQACAWDDGSLFMVARRAQLEDDMHTLDHVDIDFEFLIGDEPNEACRVMADMIGKLKALSGGRLAIAREMRELDDRLGLTPKGLAALRWKIVDSETSPIAGTSPTPPPKSRRLKSVG